MEWTQEESRVLDAQDIREPVNNILQKAMVFSGKIDIGGMSLEDIDYAVHLIRKYRAMAFGGPETRLSLKVEG